MIRTTPFHERTSALNETGPVGALVEQPGGDPLPDVREVRVLRDPQRGRPVRHVAAVQVPDPRPGRGAVPRRRARPRHPDAARPATRSTRSGATTAASSSRTGSSSATRRRRVPADRRRAEPRPTSRASSAGSTSRSRTSPTTGPSSPSRARGRARSSSPLAPGVAELPLLRRRRRRRSPRSRSRVSRTGYTGDLGYEIWVPAADALDGLGRGLGGEPRPGRRSRSG